MPVTLCMNFMVMNKQYRWNDEFFQSTYGSFVRAGNEIFSLEASRAGNKIFPPARKQIHMPNFLLLRL